MKRIKVKPIEPIAIELKDKTYVCTFSMLGMAYLQEELTKTEGKLNEVSPARMAALILYSGIKVNEPEFTMEEAVALAIKMGPAHHGDIIGAFNDSMYESMDGPQKNEIKKLMAQYLSSVRK